MTDILILRWNPLSIRGMLSLPLRVVPSSFIHKNNIYMWHVFWSLCIHS